METRYCAWEKCCKPFVSQVRNKKFCSEKCRDSYNKRTEKGKATIARYNERHRNELRRKQKLFYQRRREKKLKRNQEWAKENPDKALEKSLRWQKRNPVQAKLSRYKTNAKHRGYVWALSDEQAADLLSLPCKYCGGEGGGIDRVDSTLGYFPENCVPCCSTCNYMKRTMGVGQFIAHATKIAEYQSRLALFVKKLVGKE